MIYFDHNFGRFLLVQRHGTLNDEASLLKCVHIQGSMVAEVEARRHGVDEERKRLAERFAMLDKDKRGADAANREESERLAELVRAVPGRPARLDD